ncbi:MAG: hypothetical protein AAFR04_05505 [Pseudomonadota bacterium]
MFKKLMMASLGLLMLTGAANAATLQGVQGDVQVNRGQGFAPVSGTITLKPGDMIMARAGSQARLAYGPSCNINVRPGAVVTVAKFSPCVGGLQGYVGQTHAHPPPVPAATTGLPGITAAGAAGLGVTTAVVVGTVVVIAGVAYVVVEANDDDDDDVPAASP